MEPWVSRELPSAGFRPRVGLLLSQSPCNPHGLTSSPFWSLHGVATSLGQSTVLGWKLESDCVCMACVPVCATCEWPSMEACVLSAHMCMCLHVGLCACVYALCPSMPVCMHVCAHMCLCLHSDPPSVWPSSARPMSSSMGPVLWHSAPCSPTDSIIALLIDSLTLDKSLKFSAYICQRGKNT